MERVKMISMKLRGLDSVKSWIIALLCSLLGFLLTVPMKMNSLLFVALLERFDADRKQASMPFSVGYIVRCVSGPLLACLVKVLGLRSMIFVGSFAAIFGILICSFAEDITTVIFSFGLLYGLGMNMGASLLPQIIKQHFEKNLVLGLTVLTSGYSAATMIFYPLAQTSLLAYGFSGTFLLIAGLMLHAIPFTVALRDPKYKNTSTNTKETGNENHLEIHINSREMQGNSQGSQDMYNCNTDIETLANCNTDTETLANCNTNIEPLTNCNANIEPLTSCNANIEPMTSCNTHTESLTSCKTNIEHWCNSPSIPNSFNCAICTSYANAMLPKSVHLELREHGHNTREIQSTCTLRHFSNLKDNKFNFSLKTSALEALNSNDRLAVAKDGSKSLRRSKIKSALQTLRVFCDPGFLDILLFHGILTFLTQLFLTIIIDASRDKGIPRDLEVHYLTFLPFSQLCGGLLLGWLTNKNYLTKICLTAVSFLSWAIASQTVLWSKGFLGVFIGVIMFSFFETACAVAIIGLVFEFVEESQHSMAISSLSIIYLPLGFTLPVVIATFRETLGSYNGIFHLLTAMSLFGIVSVELLPCIAKIRTRQKP